MWNPTERSGILLKWNDETLNHVRKHNIEPEEVESIFESKKYYRKRGEFDDFLGRTFGGRIIFVALKNISGIIYQVIIARDATNSEKDLYKRKAK